MGAPAAAGAVLATTKTGRKAVFGVVAALVLVAGFLLTPLLAVPFAVAGQTAASAISDRGIPAANGEWGYPLAGDYFKGRGFGYHPVEGCSYCSKNHLGYDMSQECGSTIFAAGPGTVVTAGPLSGWGNTVRVDHGGGILTLYGHMIWGSLLVSVGDSVTAGTPLGAEGETGKSWGCHLHYEVQIDGVAVDAEPFMAALGLPLK